MGISAQFIGTFGDRNEFDYPYKSVIVGSELFICARQNDIIKVYDIDRGNIVYSREFGAGVGLLPADIASDGTHLYVAYEGSDKVTKFTIAGAFVSNITFATYRFPCAIACDGTSIFTVLENKIAITDIASETSVYFGEYGRGDTTLNFPAGIEYHGGFLYIADTFNSSIKKYTATGAFVRKIIVSGLIRPVSFDRINGFFAICDTWTGRVTFVNESFTAVDQIGGDGAGMLNLSFPQSVQSLDDVIYISDSANHRIVAYSYVSDAGADIAETVFGSIRSLYPTGYIWKMAIGSNIYKLHDAISTFLSRIFNDAFGIKDACLPDSDRFTVTDLTDWEKQYGLLGTGTFEDRKNAVAQAMAYPGGILARQSTKYIEDQLRLAGFDVTVVYNRYPNDVYSFRVGTARAGTARANNNSFANSTSRFKRLEPVAGWTEICANYIDPAMDAGVFDAKRSSNRVGTSRVGKATAGADATVNRELQLRSTAFVTGNVSIARKKEFRNLILRLKPRQMAYYLYVNYI